MTAGSPSSAADRRPLLVLGLGNTLLCDDGAGLSLLAALSGRAHEWGERVEFLDGGTQGLALLGEISGRPALVILDAVELGAPPGTIHILREIPAHRPSTAHEGNAGELLAAAQLLGDCPDNVVVIGIEPAEVRTGIGLSEPVVQGLDAAVEKAARIIDQLLATRVHS